MDSVAMTLHPFNYLRGKRYYGYSDGSSAFMTGADSFDFDGDGNAEEFYPLGFRQYFDKPATALRLNEVTMWITTNFPSSSVCPWCLPSSPPVRA
jgi:hypothetical protein